MVDPLEVMRVAMEQVYSSFMEVIAIHPLALVEAQTSMDVSLEVGLFLQVENSDYASQALQVISEALEFEQDFLKEEPFVQVATIKVQ